MRRKKIIQEKKRRKKVEKQKKRKWYILALLAQSHSKSTPSLPKLRSMVVCVHQNAL